MYIFSSYGPELSNWNKLIRLMKYFNGTQEYVLTLNVKNEVTKLLRPGILWSDYHKEVGKIMTSELLRIKLLDKSDIQSESKQKPAYKKYFSHNNL